MSMWSAPHATLCICCPVWCIGILYSARWELLLPRFRIGSYVWRLLAVCVNIFTICARHLYKTTNWCPVLFCTPLLEERFSQINITCQDQPTQSCTQHIAGFSIKYATRLLRKIQYFSHSLYPMKIKPKSVEKILDVVGSLQLQFKPLKQIHIKISYLLFSNSSFSTSTCVWIQHSVTLVRTVLHCYIIAPFQNGCAICS